MTYVRRPEKTSKQLLYAARVSAVLMPLAVVLYLIISPSLQKLGYISDFNLILTAVSWLLLGTFIATQPIRGRIQMAVTITVYHMLLAGFIITATGFNASVTYLWAILLLMAFIYFGFNAFYVSIMTLTAVALIDSYLHDFSFSVVSVNILSAFVISVIGGLSLGIVRGSDINQYRLDKAKSQAELQHGRLLTLVNNLADAIVSLDSSGRVTLYNAALLGVLDTNTRLEGQYIDEILSLYDTDEKHVNIAKELRKISAVTIRDDVHMKAGDEIIRLELTISPIRGTYTESVHHEARGWIVIIRDVTQAKSLEEERDEFISVVSHELRTPITVAEGTVSNAMLLMTQKHAKEKVSSAIKMAHDQIIFLSRMVNDLSTLSRAERGIADTKEDIEVDDLLHSLYNEYLPEAEAKGLRLNLGSLTRAGSVYASRLYLKELLQNFISNAIKYTREGSVSITVKHPDTSRIQFVIKDTGIGISKNDQKRIFEKFYRAEDYRTRETNGTGLGLYVASKLARKLNAKISVTSRLNHGSTFTLEIPTKNDTPS